MQYLGESYSDQCSPLTIGSLSVECSHCGALSFPKEHGRIKHNCCHHNKIKLDPAHPYPEALKNLLFGSDNDFRKNIRFYNSAFAMAAFCASEEISFKGISCVTLRGNVNAMATTSVIPANVERPRFAQINIHENESAVECRTSDRCKSHVLNIIQNVMNNNPYAKAYKTLFETYQKHPSENIRLEFHRLVTTDSRRYNLPTSGAAAEVSAIIVTGADGFVPNEVDFIAYPRHQYECQKMYKLSHHIEPMVFPLLFPSGDPGFSLNVQNNAGPNRVTTVQYFGWRLRVLKEFNVFTLSGGLTQQYILHGYITMEWNRLNYIQTHQQQFRRETLQGLIDHVEHSDANTSNVVRLGKVVVLPSSFAGSPRSMHQHFQDAMALSRDIGRPDLFITFTANPQWPEIKEFLQQQPAGFTAFDIPHVVVRAFFCRFEEFVKEIAAGNVFGKIMGYTYNIEFQKRGLPHAHCLFILNSRDKLLTPSSIDRFIVAEIPPKDNFPNLHQKVMKHMLHGPHSESTPCYDNMSGKCQKKFPFVFREETDMSGDGFPLYRRRDNRQDMYFYNKRISNKLISVDNSMVVPYNPYLLLKHDCHINVEYCGSVMAYKYIFKYVNKGHERITVTIRNHGNEGRLRNEVDDFVDSRYVSSMEAAWRLLELPMHDNSHSVIRLPVHVHLPGNQHITFQEGHESEAINSGNTVTQLIAFFQLNSTDPDARQYKYIQIPKHYVWVQKDRKWKKRLRGSEKLVVRIYAVSPKDSERFFLKFLLQHICGPLSFEHLRTVEGTTFNTFREAAYCLEFGDGDEKIEEILAEVSHHMMPKQLRIFFACLLLTCSQINARNLWEKFQAQMCEGGNLKECLLEIECRLNSEDRTLSNFGLPSFTDIPPSYVDDFSSSEHSSISQDMISKLNAEQKKAFEEVIRCIEDSNCQNKLFFVDGPDGTGKTFLYKCLYHHQRHLNKRILCVAWTGIAAILLPNGRTAHRVFKLPITMPSEEENLSPIYLDKKSKQAIVEANLIIWDEASMIPAAALNLIDVTLRDLLNSNQPFGGKNFLFGGDFRQVLPVMKRAGKYQIINGTIKSLPVWTQVKNFSLSRNMRATEKVFSNWLLNIGNGVVEQLAVSDMLCEDIVTETFGQIITEDALFKSVLLAPLNEQVNKLNNMVLQKLPGAVVECHSYDKATACDGDETDDESVMLRFQPEYLAKINITGMPLNNLKLKIGAVVMLVRNLCVADGLCNGTRLIVRKITKSALFCTIMTGSKAGNSTCIPRITLNTSDSRELPFVLHRTQFPVRLAFAMTINKSQGQTFDKLGLYIDQNSPIFTHDQLYVALSRCRTKSGLKIQIVGARDDN